MAEAAAPDGRCILMPLILCLFQLVCGGVTNVTYADGLGKESLSRSLTMSSMEHVVGIVCLGRRGGEIGNGGSGLGFFFIRVEELRALGRVRFVRRLDGVIVGVCTLHFFVVFLLFWHYGLWSVSRAIVGALFT